jgi:hypothetical protein
VCLLQLRVKQRSVGNVSVITIERLLGHYIHVHKAKQSIDKISINSANHKLSLAHPQATVTVQITVLAGTRWPKRLEMWQSSQFTVPG